MGAFTKLFSRLKLTSDPAVTTQTATVIQADTTNSSLVIAPNGTGGIIASVPDGTATGGGARGIYAVDLQMSRTNANQVASQSYTFLGGGQDNRVSQPYNLVVGGYQNAATTGNYAAVLGGRGNQSTANYTFLGAGLQNQVMSDYSTISGGQSNTASTSTHATVVGGQSNTASGLWSIAGGVNAVASNRSVSLGFTNTAAGRYSVALGAYSATTMNGQFSFSPGQISAQSDNQWTVLQPYKLDTLTTAGTTVLGVDGNPATGIILPTGNNRAWNVTIDTIAVVTAITGTATGVSVGDCYRETKQLLFKRIGGTSSIVGTVDTTAVKSDSGMSTAIMTVASGGSQEMALTFTAPTFTGGGSVTCRVVSKVMLVEVAY